MMISVKRIENLINTPKEKSGNYVGKDIEQQDTVIEMKNISFSYREDKTEADPYGPASVFYETTYKPVWDETCVLTRSAPGNAGAARRHSALRQAGIRPRQGSALPSAALR